jgi:EAL domain-containing protein (putative c-di-GMP-specific phosphodiesterase class I)
LLTLHKEGCHEAQGYLFSEPVPAASVDALIKRIAAGHAGRDEKALAA